MIEAVDREQLRSQGRIAEAIVQGLERFKDDCPGMLLRDRSAKAAQDLPQREASGCVQLAPGPVVFPLPMHLFVCYLRLLGKSECKVRSLMPARTKGVLSE